MLPLRVAGAVALLVASGWGAGGRAGDGAVEDVLLTAPAGEGFAAWATNASTWRGATLAAMNYTSAAYGVPALQWASQGNWFQLHVMAYDAQVWSAQVRNYTLGQYIASVAARVGVSPDSVVLWLTLPWLGLDNRNQLELMRSAPGE
jgi:gamma-glutamyl hercynylcysteine S-oxide synthase